MQVANLSAAAIALLLCDALTTPVGSSDLQACSAAWNVGEFGLTLCGSGAGPPVLGVSGKFGSPCVRMHCANATLLAFVGDWALVLAAVEVLI